MQSPISSRHLNAILVLVMMVGTATFAILALGVIIFATVLLHTALDAIIELAQTVIGLYTHGDALTRFLLLVFIFFLLWKAAPHVIRYVRCEIAACPFLFMRGEAVKPQSSQKEGCTTHVPGDDDSAECHDKEEITITEPEDSTQQQSTTTSSQADAMGRTDLRTVDGHVPSDGARRKMEVRVAIVSS